MKSGLSKAAALAEKTLKAVIYALILVSSAAVLVMIGVTILDIVLRMMRIRFIGAVDIVQIAGAVAIAAALPYTTAINAHVAIEFLFHKLSRRGRLVLGSTLKILTILLFSLTSYQCFIYGGNLLKNNQVTMTLRFPQFWMMYMIAVCLAIVVAVLLHSLLRPHKELMKP
jgi:TRAP-type C4-dicarboxylate transport system permease small subunit